MAKGSAVHRSAKNGRFITVNGAYVKKQASEAVTTFFAPLSGAWEALIQLAATHYKVVTG